MNLFSWEDLYRETDRRNSKSRLYANKCQRKTKGNLPQHILPSFIRDFSMTDWNIHENCTDILLLLLKKKKKFGRGLRERSNNTTLGQKKRNEISNTRKRKSSKEMSFREVCGWGARFNYPSKVDGNSTTIQRKRERERKDKRERKAKLENSWTW